jgi:hypothetical protein
MVITLINPSPSKGRRFKIKSSSKKGKVMSTSARKKTMAMVKRDLNNWSKYPWGIKPPKKGKKSMAKKAKSHKAAKKTTYTRRKKLRKGHHRPIVLWTGTRFKRPKRSKIFKHPTRINPRRSRRHSRLFRRNPLRLPMGLDRSLMAGLPVAGGIAISMFAMPQIVKYLPASVQAQGKFFGLVHVALGVAAMSLVKKDVVKTLGGTILAMGLYDLIACNIPQLQLPALPGRTAANGAGFLGASYTQYPAVGTDYTPALGASYGDDIDYGGDSIEIG